ncbi:hypothetical protein [Sandaracinus amylolyticus]|uniref:hypothetical protein n=1 Tax=Sandaracinus amylolyticus TaxID=927083 RepID=UPI001F45EF79|nr:hypothetical protein [Sandaracinus amylolyticus]
MLASCVLPPIDLTDRSCPCIDGWICDTARNRCVPLDAFGDAGVTSPDPCNGRDDDEDGRTDEGPDACGTPPGAIVSCVGATCVLSCAVGFADCNGIVADGCEASLIAATSCGACAVRCEDPLPFCVEDDAGRFHCSDQCASDRTLCGSSCVDLATSASHCGGCDQACELRPGVASSCVDGACTYACQPDRADCDSDASTCETEIDTVDACGACDTPCATEHNAATCVDGACTIGPCESGWGHCGPDSHTGCETSLHTTTDCGACGVECDLQHATESCETGICTMGVCDPGWADCSDEPGCETDLSSTSSCGGCGVTCDVSESCASVGCAAPEDVIELVAGDDFACARLTDGRVSCWGADDCGQLGNGSAGPSNMAVLVAGVTDAIDLAAGAHHACAVRRGGQVVCWGENAYRQLGNAGPGSDQPAPVTVRNLGDAVQVAAGDDHTCARRAGGRIACWGRNDDGQLGNGSIGGDRSSPGDVEGVTDARELAAGGAHTCAVLQSGSITCWGENARGQLGDGTTMRRPSASAVAGITDARMIALGAESSCALRADATVWCWGANSSQQLGDGTTTDRTAPTLVRDVPSARAIACGDQHACLVTTGSTVTCWGANASGQLGDGTISGGAPRATGTLLDAVAIAAGRSHTCAVRDEGSAKCWGSGADGRLGDGSGADQVLPVAVLGLP